MVFRPVQTSVITPSWVGSQENQDDTWAVTVSLEGKLVILHIDTVTEVTVIAEQTWKWKAIGRPVISLPDRTL